VRAGRAGADRVDSVSVRVHVHGRSYRTALAHDRNITIVEIRDSAQTLLARQRRLWTRAISYSRLCTPQTRSMVCRRRRSPREDAVRVFYGAAPLDGKKMQVR